MSSLALLTKLAAMLRNVPAVQFVFAKFAALLRSIKGSGEPLISDFLGEAPAVNRNMADDDVDVSKPSSNRAIAAPETIDQSEREKLIRRRWLETGIKMWNPDVHGAGHAALNIQGRAELLPPKPGETLPGYARIQNGSVLRQRAGGEPYHLRGCCCRSAKASQTFYSRDRYDNNWNLMLFGRMYPARLRAPERSGALLFWPERYGRGRVVDRPFAEPIELPKGKRLDHLARRCALRHQAPQGGARRRRIVEHNEPTMFARIGVMRALNCHVERVFDPSPKDKHWGGRKLARDR